MNRSFALTLLLGLAACSGADGGPGVAETCFGHGEDPSLGKTFTTCRVFRGRLQLPPGKELPLPSRPLQLVAMGAEPLTLPADGGLAIPESGTTALDGSPAGADAGSGLPAPAAAPTDQIARYFFYGPPFAAIEGGGQRPSVPFAVVVPCGLSVNLLLQVLRTSSDSAPGLQVAQMAFPATEGAAALTTLIPRQPLDTCGAKTNQLDLGVVTLTLARRGELASGSILLGKGNSKSPLTLLGPPEGTVSDQDTDGDGIIDAVETFAALPDQLTPGAAPEDPPAPQPDGVPDIFQ